LKTVGFIHIGNGKWKMENGKWGIENKDNYQCPMPYALRTADAPRRSDTKAKRLSMREKTAQPNLCPISNYQLPIDIWHLL